MAAHRKKDSQKNYNIDNIFHTILISARKLIPKNSKIVLGFSGGPDSVFLFYVLNVLLQEQYISELIAAHLDHQWRPDSSKDLLFCKKVASNFKVYFEHATLQEIMYEKKWHGSQEEYGRKARRLFLQQVRQTYNANLIALAHHQDDQIETFIIRLIRGASLSGLCAMEKTKGYYIRPLLDINKAYILHYLQAKNISYLNDPSNQSFNHLRNRIRHNIIPAFELTDPRYAKNILHTIKRLQQADHYLSEETKNLFESLSNKKNDSINISLILLLSQPVFLQYRLLSYWFILEKVIFTPSESFFAEIIRLLSSSKKETVRTFPGWELHKKENIAYIIKKVIEQ